MVERTRQITYNYKSVTPVIVANFKHKQVIEGYKQLAKVALENPLQGYDSISERYEDIMRRKKEELKRKRAFIELQEITRNIATKINTMPNQIAMVALEAPPPELR